MQVLYAIGMGGLYALMWCAARFNAKARKWIDGRKIPLSQYTVPGDRPVAWFHCASLGEFDQALPVMFAYKERFPDAWIVVSFFSPSGMEFYHKRQHCVDVACYLPLDTAGNARRFIRHFKPVHVFFVKYEFWYNHLLAAQKSGAAVYGVSSLFRPPHRFFKWYGGFFRSSLRLFDHFFVQDERSLQLLQSIGIKVAEITGDTRYDRMIALKDKGERNETLAAFCGEEEVLILGSSWPVDEETFLPELRKLKERMKIIIAPHDISSAHIQSIAAMFDGEVVRYSTYRQGNERILILDTIGHLSAAYRYGSLAYVGGGFTGKLHNILEPGAFGLPVIFGPRHERFPEAQLFLDCGVSMIAADAAEFGMAVASLQLRASEISAALEEIFRRNSGAAQKVIDRISRV